MFNNYAIVQGVDTIIPVDVYAPGCPPGPETLLHAIVTLRDPCRPASTAGSSRSTSAGSSGPRPASHA
jgi:NADH-quinone oxidoreductase subunit B